MKRLFDIVVSLLAIVVLLPLFLVIAVMIAVSSRGGIFYVQKRVGRNNVDFDLFKFRTMRTGSDRSGLLTVGAKDPRITGVGYYLRKYKIDELPQLFNVFLGNMSLVGPRPEVRKYVNMYNSDQLRVLSVRPGITDLASLEYFSENDLLAKSTDPESAYINSIMPAKLRLNEEYILNASLKTDLSILWKTILKIFSKH